MTTSQEAHIKNSASWPQSGFLYTLLVALISVTLFIAPVAAAHFPTFSPPGYTPPSGLLNWMTWFSLPLMILPVAAAVLVTVYTVSRRPLVLTAAPYVWVTAVLLLGWAALSCIGSLALFMSLNALAVLACGIAMAALISHLAQHRNTFFTLISALVAGAGVEAAMGVREYLMIWKTGITNYRVFGTFINPDFLAGYLLLTIMPTIALFTGTRMRHARFGYGTALALQTACLLLTGSRAGIAAFLAELMLWLFLAHFSGALQRCRRNLVIAAVLMALGAIPALTPLLSRGENIAPTRTAAHTKGAPVMQSNSILFRIYTWRGTIDMAEHNLLKGTGLGTFDQGYPRYSTTAYTAHAHNSMLQWTAETGLPGAFFLLFTLAAVAAFGANALRLRRTALAAPNSGEQVFHPLCEEPALLLTALLAALTGSLLKTLIDSDWYIVCTLFALSASCGFLIGLAREVAPLATLPPKPLSKTMLGLVTLGALLAIVRAAQTLDAAWLQAQGAQLLQNQSPQAIALYQQAAQADPFNPDGWLRLASLQQSMHNTSQEKAALLKAVQAASIGRTWYRLGQFYQAQNNPGMAVAAFQKALACDPHNLQTLHQIGNTYLMQENTAQAQKAFSTMTNLEHAPYGTVRAIADQVVEVEYAYAHAGLADIALQQGNASAAAGQYQSAAAILRLYWKWRHTPSERASLSPPRQEAVYHLYLSVLKDWSDALKQLNNNTQIAALNNEKQQVEADHAKDMSQSETQ